MREKKYNILVFIGRFQPYHNGHKRVVDRALELADHVLLLVGSSNSGRSMRNPFTFDEREQMIDRSHQSTAFEKRMPLAIPLNDMMYNDTGWIEQVQDLVGNYAREVFGSAAGLRIGLIGCNKDESSYYLKLFPTWGSEAVEFFDPINATDLRESYWTYGMNRHWVSYDAQPRSIVEDQTPPEVADWLRDFQKSEAFRELREEKAFVDHYKQSVTKYPRIEHTTDAVVVQSGHILLIRRRAAPGKGKWALPGGFLNPTETLVNGMLRELREETKIKVPEAVLRGNIKATAVFDNPYRSARGRIITQAYYIELPPQVELPKVRGSDDADKARWVPLSEVDPKEMFEDHYFIIQKMIGGF